MRLKQSATVIGAALLVGGFGTAAMAAGTITPTTASDTAATSAITVNFSGLNPADGVVFIQQCWIDGNAPGATFNPTTDCNQSTASTNAAILAGGSGSKVLNVFNGDEPNLGEWGCGPLTSSGIPVDPSGVCYIRLAPGVKGNVTTDEFIPFTYAAAPSVPEVPLNVLLPASAAAVLGAGFLVARKRQLKANAA